MMKNETILIWGAGAIGASLGAAFLENGYDVLFVDQEKEHVDAINNHGLRIEGPIREGTYQTKACLPEDVKGKFRTIFLSVKAHHTPIAIQQILPHLQDDSIIVSAQNGLNELEIAKFAGIHRTMGCFVNFGADYIKPGTIHYGGRAAVVCGALSADNKSRAEEIFSLLQLFDDRAILTDNILGYLWGKLVYGAMLFATALTDEPIWKCFDAKDAHDVFIALGKEISAVAAAENITLESFDGFDPLAFSPSATYETAIASMNAMAHHNKGSLKTHSGIWRDLAVRKRRTEIDAQIGPILDFAKKHHLSTPVLENLIKAIHRCEDGYPRQWSNMSALLEKREASYAN